MNQVTHSRHPIRSQRKPDGAILICVLVCLGIAATMTMTALQASLRHRRQMSDQWQLEQTRWLLDAGLARAAGELKADPNYDGETWQVDGALTRYETAIVVISVAKNPDESDERTLRLTAEIGSDASLFPPTKRSRTWVVNVSE